MPTPNEIVREIEKSIAQFNASVPKTQEKVFDEIQALTKQLTVKNGRIKASAENIRLIGKIKLKLEQLLLTPQYKDKVQDFLDSFSRIGKLQNEYFEEIIAKYQPPKVLEAIRQESVNAAIDNLTEAGLHSSVIKPVREILRRNITTGAPYSKLVGDLRTNLLSDKNGDGSLVKYARTITTDALNTFARENLNTVTNDQGLEWFSYNGPIIDSSRPFCVAMHKKKFFHKSEIPKLLEGDFPEFKEAGGTISEKTGLPVGMIEGTNADNFLVNLGGYGCGHQAVPVHESAVPEKIKKALNGEQETSLQEQFLPEYPVKLSEDIFKGIAEKGTEIELEKNPYTAYYSPTANRVVIDDTDERFTRSEWFKENVVYHEVGHATHHTHGIITQTHVDTQFKKAFNAARKSVKGKEEEMERELDEKLNTAQAEADHDVFEQSAAALDMLGALTGGKYGYGHDVIYYNTFNRKYSEAFAHASEVYHGKNEVLETTMPEVQKIFKDYLEDFYSNL